MLVPAKELKLGGLGTDYDPNSVFAQDTQVASQAGSTGVAVVYVIIEPNQYGNDATVQTFGMFGVDDSGAIMIADGDLACLPCPKFCP